MGKAKRAAILLWRVVNAASTGQWVWSIAGGLPVSVASLLLDLPLAAQVALALALLLSIAASILTYLEHRSGTLQKINAASQVEAELVRAREEATHANALLAHTDPVTAAMVKAVWPDWRTKMAAYVSLAVSPGAGSRFNPIGREETVMALGEPVAVNLDIGADIKLLDDSLSEVRSVVIEASHEALEKAARARRENDAASLFSY